MPDHHRLGSRDMVIGIGKFPEAPHVKYQSSFRSINGASFSMKVSLRTKM
jgi:hypothetical protein